MRPNLPIQGSLGINERQGLLIMPFKPAWAKGVEKAVSAALARCGMKCLRADRLRGRDVILDVWRSICSSGVIVADLTGGNANVMYELGLAEAIGKRILLVSQDDDHAFDIRGLRFIKYSAEDLQALTAELCRSLRHGMAPRGRTAPDA